MSLILSQMGILTGFVIQCDILSLLNNMLPINIGSVNICTEEKCHGRIHGWIRMDNTGGHHFCFMFGRSLISLLKSSWNAIPAAFATMFSPCCCSVDLFLYILWCLLLMWQKLLCNMEKYMTFQAKYFWLDGEHILWGEGMLCIFLCVWKVKARKSPDF